MGSRLARFLKGVGVLFSARQKLLFEVRTIRSIPCLELVDIKVESNQMLKALMELEALSFASVITTGLKW